MGAPPESKAPLSTSSEHNGVSGGGRSGGVCTPDSARCCAPVPVPSPSGGVFVLVSMALTRGIKSASKANLNLL